MQRRGSRAARMAKALVLVALTLAIGFLAGTGAAKLSFDAGIGAPGSVAANPELLNQSTNVAYTAWDEAESPNYYRVLGPAEVVNEPEPGTIVYEDLDAQGRARGARGLITYTLMDEGRSRSRENLMDVSPSGWGHNQEVDMAMPDGRVYHGQLFNRSHLIAKSLGGDDKVHNLVTATRTQNVGASVEGTEGGMAYGEGLARMWLESHPEGTVYYAATPAYKGKELVPRSVIVDIRTGDGSIDQRVEVYNAARGFAIDYATGTFAITESAEDAARLIRERNASLSTDVSTGSDMPESESVLPDLSGTETAAPETTDTQRVVPEGTSESVDGERKVIVTGSGHAYHHDETCSGLEHARSMEWVTVSEAESMGRHACGICGG